ncbi:MAG: 4-alpha-glucanotransferase [Anaerotignaceae bacterium]
MEENKRKSGILLHPTSLPSAFGIGDFGKGAYDFVDYLERSNQKLWQTLPMGPTSFKDSPYQSFSAFAGNYYLISPEKLLEDGLIEKEDLKCGFDEDFVDYGKIIPFKKDLLKKAFLKFKKTKAYQGFINENSFWLEDYSLFAALKDYYIEKRKLEYESEDFKAFALETDGLLTENQQKDYYYGGAWVSWDKEISLHKESAVSKFKKELSKEMNFYKFLQFLFFKQWGQVKDYANQRGIEIIGDIPIFIAYDSADTWANQSLFKLNEKGFPVDVAGVPPDYFSKTGQLWGNPLYNWEKHEEEGYLWWINRIKILLKTADIIRIDHFRGFESNFAIKFGSKDATKGNWIKGPNKKLFNAIAKEVGKLPIIAEDLGIITDKVTKLRKDTGLPGMKILQFAFDDSPNNDYLPHNYEKNCVVYTGTHDNDTTLGWYKSTTEEVRDYFRRYMNSDGSNPAWDLIRLAMASPAEMAIFPLQDVLCLGTKARMNEPSTEENNWQWRYTQSMLNDGQCAYLSYLTDIFRR